MQDNQNNPTKPAIRRPTLIGTVAQNRPTRPTRIGVAPSSPRASIGRYAFIFNRDDSPEE